MKRITTATLIGTLVVLFGMASAEARPGKGGHFQGKGIKMFFGDITLTAEQQEEIDALQESFREQTRALGKEAHELHKQMHDLWQAENLDAKAIKALQKTINDLHGQMEELHIDFRLNAMAILTPKQRAELRAKMAERFEKGSGKGGQSKRPGMGPGPGFGEGPDCPFADEGTTQAE